MNLFGRDDQIKSIQQNINRAIISDIPSVLISSINGMPAVGKTALALNIAYEFIDQFPDSQLYIDCFGYTAGHDPLQESEILDLLLLSLKISSNIIPGTFSEKNILWQNILMEKRIIVIFDNINSISQINNLLPLKGSSLVLITSRSYIPNLSETHRIIVDILDETSAIQLLYQTSEKSGDEFYPLFKAIAKKCGYLPLALQVIASRMKNRKHLKFVERFINSEDNLNLLVPGENPVFESFNLSYVLLDNLSKNVLRIMGICPCIEVTPEICAIMLKEDEQYVGTALDLLFEQHLVDEIGDDRYRLHDLMRDFARIKFIQEEHVNEQEVVSLLISSWLMKINHTNKIIYPNEYCFINTDEDCPTPTLNYKDAIEWLNLELSNFLSCLEYLNKEKKWNDYISFLYVLGPHIRRRMPSDTVIKYGNDAINNSESSPLNGLCNTYLALAHEQAGNFATAIYYFDNAEKIWDKLHETEAQAYVLSNKGFTLERLGDYTNALTVLSQAIEKYKKTKNKYGEGFVLNAIGAVNWRMKRYQNAKAIFLEALSLRENNGDKIGLSSTANNLGFTYLMLKDSRNALLFFNRSLEISRSYGDLHGESVTTNNMGYYFIQKKDYKSAIGQALLARELAKQVGDDYQLARSYEVEAEALIGLSEGARALESLKIAMGLFRLMNVPESYEAEELIKKLPNSTS